MDKQSDIIWLEQTDSTNRYAKDNFDALSDGTLALAEAQTAGKGRLGRVWQSPAGQNIYASFVMKNSSNPGYASMAASLGALKVLREVAPEVKCWLKWPNDIYCRDKKIAGILCETKTGSGNVIVGIIAGMGININMPPEELANIDQPATSLLNETGKKYNLKKIAEKLAISLLGYYIMHSNFPNELYACWKQENLLIGQTVDILTGKDVLRGKIADLGPDGEIIFDTGHGTLKLYSGDVKIEKSSLDFSLF